MKSYIATQQDPPFGRRGNRNWRFSATQKSNVYDAICDSGREGLTRAEIASKVGLAPDRISFYLSDLRRAGYIAIKGDPTQITMSMTADEALLAWMLAGEEALAIKVREGKKTKEMEIAFVKYLKMKERALQPMQTQDPKMGYMIDSSHEVRSALRMCLVELVKCVV